MIQENVKLELYAILKRASKNSFYEARKTV